jgi:hypothetical protein
MTLKLRLLPKLDDSEFYRSELENALIAVRDQIENIYNDKIKVIITTTSISNEEMETVLSYGVYLSFPGKNNFSYRIMDFICKRPEGGLPVIVNAYSPSQYIGEMRTIDQLNQTIESVFADQRTRNIILSNYKM